MRAKPGRSKKLIVAFHFQFAKQAAWRCDECRKLGLEKRRRCAWAGSADSESERIVWGRRQIAVTRCPKSVITGESMYLLEEFSAWKLCAAGSLRTMPARVADAILILENEFRAELVRANRERDGQPNRR
jgi:hypothetical protein